MVVNVNSQVNWLLFLLQKLALAISNLCLVVMMLLNLSGSSVDLLNRRDDWLFIVLLIKDNLLGQDLFIRCEGILNHRLGGTSSEIGLSFIICGSSYKST
jgi:hypothetical protein